MASSEAPTFNGLSSEVFTAGTRILDTWDILTAEQKKQALPHLLGHMQGAIVRAREFSSDDMRAMGQELHETAEALESHAEDLERRSRPFEPQPEDDYQN